jgi:HK97 family phage major capsid protein
MKTSKELKEERGQLLNEMNSIVQTAETEKRELTPEQQTRFTELRELIEGMEKKISDAEFLEDQNRRNAAKNIAQTQQKNEDKQIREYSFVRAIRSKIGEGEKLDGFELEMHQEAAKEAREMGLKVEGIGIPQMIINPEKRTILAGTETELIPTIKTGFIDMLQARLVLQSLGVNFMTGLSGNFSMPRGTAGATAAWKAENAEAVESTQTFDEITMSPKKLTTYSQYSKQMLLQSVVAIESYVRNDLMMATALEVDRTGINGSGSSPEPRGILNVVGIGSVALGDNGDVPSYENIIALLKEVEIDNADMGVLGFLTNPQAKARLMVTKTDAGSGLFVWDKSQPTNLIGYNARVTTQVPSTLTKGTGTGLSAMIYGDFSSLIIGQWGGLDLIVDPYTLATYGYVRVVIHSFWDMAVKHAQSFAAIKDMVTTL